MVAQSPIEKIAIDILSDQFGIPVREIVELTRQSQHNAFDLAPTLSTARLTRRSANEVMRLREEGMGWGVLLAVLALAAVAAAVWRWTGTVPEVGTVTSPRQGSPWL